MKTAFRRSHSLLLQAIAAVTMLHVTLAVAMSVAPRLHAELHHDAKHEDHECAVTHLLNGDCWDGVTTLDIAVPSALLCADSVTLSNVEAAFVPPLFLKDGLLVHGPPALR